MIGALAGRQGIRMPRLQAECISAVLQAESPSGWDGPRPKSHIVAVDERAGVAMLVDDAQVNGIRSSSDAGR